MIVRPGNAVIKELLESLGLTAIEGITGINIDIRVNQIVTMELTINRQMDQAEIVKLIRLLPSLTKVHQEPPAPDADFIIARSKCQ